MGEGARADVRRRSTRELDDVLTVFELDGMSKSQGSRT